MPPRKKRNPFRNIILGVYKPPPERDPRDCDERCPHDVKCLGGHAGFPGQHWYPLGDPCTASEDDVA